MCRVLSDLVFLQNGMLQPWLDSRGLGDNTQVGQDSRASKQPVMHRTGRSILEVMCSEQL